jgi:NADH-quinone oxidoreductase subunit F
MAGGMRGGKKLKGVIPGGSSMPVLTADVMMSLDMDYDSIQKAGSFLGSGAVIVMDEDTCMVKAAERLAYFYFEESCGQCTPCREGTGWLYRIIHRIETGEGRRKTSTCCSTSPTTSRAAPSARSATPAAMPVRAFVKTFRDEFQYHIDHKRCQVKPGGYSSARAHSRERWRRTDMPINLEIDGKPSRSTTAPR